MWCIRVGVNVPLRACVPCAVSTFRATPMRVRLPNVSDVSMCDNPVCVCACARVRVSVCVCVFWTVKSRQQHVSAAFFTSLSHSIHIISALLPSERSSLSVIQPAHCIGNKNSAIQVPFKSFVYIQICWNFLSAKQSGPKINTRRTKYKCTRKRCVFHYF